METDEIDLAPVDSTTEMQRMFAANVSDRVAEIVEILGDDHALAVTAEIETD